MHTRQSSPVRTPTTPTMLAPVRSGLLQRKCACGNHTVAGGECAECAKNKSGLQRKLTIGTSNDPLEREADRVADQVMAAPGHSAVSGARPRIQRYAGQATEGTNTAPVSVDRVLASSGRPLEPGLRQDMEQRFGYDFSRVRVHSGAAAEQSARDVNALAYTIGRDLVFGVGQYVVDTHAGQHLIAHELAHVVQQASGPGAAAPSAASQATGVLQRQDDGKKVPVETIYIPPVPRRPPTGLPDPRSLGKAVPCRTKITPMSCSELEELGGPQVQTLEVGGVEDTHYIFTCTDASCIASATTSQWIILPKESDSECGDMVDICANGFRTQAEVVDHRLGYNFYVSTNVALALGAPTNAPFQGVILDSAASASQWACCPEANNFGGQPGDFPSPEPNERVV